MKKNRFENSGSSLNFRLLTFKPSSLLNAEQNQILRSKSPERIELSNQARCRLVKHGKKVGARIKELISIVSHSTFRKGVRSVEDTPDKRPKPKDAMPGRPRVEESISEAISRIRKETCWGQDEDSRRSLEAGFNFHAVKPMKIAALETLLAGYVQAADRR